MTPRRSPRSSRLKKSKEPDLFDSKQKYLDELIENVNKLKREMKKPSVCHLAPLPKMDTAENRLFQIPFSKMVVEYYKGLECKSHSVLRALHVLELRSTSLCIEDSKRIYEMYEEGASISNCDIATYLSTIYETDVTAEIHKDDKMPYLDLKEGYATLVSVQTYDKDEVSKHDDEKSISGTIIIIYKYNSVIYCYHPYSKKNTVSINEILEELNTYRIEEYICFYKDSGVATLNRAKMVAPILY